MLKYAMTAALCVTCTSAYAAKWDVDVGKSKLTFEATQTGEAFIGHFRKFNPEIDLDESAPEKGLIHVTVDMASLDIDGEDREEALPTDDWFATKKYPKAEFVSRTIKRTGTYKPTGMNFFEVTGDLRIRDVTKLTTFTFVIKHERGDYVRAIGEATINRSDFKIGQGRWADEQWIAFPVKVHFNLLAKPK